MFEGLWRALTRKTSHRAQVLPDADEHVIVVDDPSERVLGCGWFDSSHDLREGLRVVDDPAASRAALARELSIADWLAWHDWERGHDDARGAGLNASPPVMAFG